MPKTPQLKTAQPEFQPAARPEFQPAAQPTTQSKITRPKMPIKQRAKQFMPFSALNGFDEALRRKEWEVETQSKLKDRLRY